MIEGKNVLIGVTGGIAIYKTLDLISRLKKKGANVKVVMTEAATEFIRPITFQTLSDNPVYVEMFDQFNNQHVGHINLAKWSDIILIAPATANTIGKIANGICDNLLTSVIMAARCKVMIAPTMNTAMLENEATQKNLEILKERGFVVLDTNYGLLACNDKGNGKMLEPRELLERIECELTAKTLNDKKIIVTAGPSQENFDPVRYVTNPSSGKMGYAIATEARNRGGEVVLISGPTNLDQPWGMEFVPVSSTEDMFNAVDKFFGSADILVKSAAPSDHRPKYYYEEKLKKEDERALNIEFVVNPDIAAHFGNKKEGQIVVGFAAESEDLIENGKRKLQEKNFDFIVVNDITASDAGFKSDTNVVHIIDDNLNVQALTKMSKQELACEILNRIEERIKS